MKKKTYLFNSMLAAVLFAAGLTMGACADNDLDNSNSEGDQGAVVSFDIKDVQEAVLADQTPNTPSSRAGATTTFNHQLTELGLTQADLKPQVLEAQTPAGMEACLVETTIPGINPIQHDPQTRAMVTKTLIADFSTLGCRGTSATNISSTPDWFYKARTKSNGELYEKLLWAWSKRFGRFYGVYPEVKDTYTKIKISPDTHAGNPYVEFEVDPDVANQKDLMTACSGVVEYQTQGVAPNTSLAFRHALTAVHFTVGQNLWAGRINKIEISGAINKGTYTLSSDPNQLGTWALGTTTGTCTLSGININTATSPGSVITDDNGNYTFFMIPQEVTGKNIYVDIHFQDGKTIHVPLKGKWLPGTTKTYTLSNKQSNWQYHLEVLGQNNTAAYDATDAGTYTVRSYRQANGVQLPVAWKIVSYQESADGGLTWGAETQTKPTWLTNLSLTEGVGGTSAQQGTATVKKDITDRLAAYNKVLQDAPAKGSVGNYYDLSTHDYQGNSTQRNTANSYVISAPGYYKIPLVYGNAIKNGTTNSHAYISNAPAGNSNVLYNFIDHAGEAIDDPWITKTHGGANVPDGARLVWADQKGIVEKTSVGLEGSGDNAFVHFHIPQDKIKNGNALIAVSKGGVIVWSWHLWFNHTDAVGTVACTNHQGNVYHITKQTLGQAWRKWLGTTYDKPRQVRIKVEQIPQNGGVKQHGTITITQKSYSEKEVISPHYQYGRKDPMPPVQVVSDGAYNQNGGSWTDIKNDIQHPETFYGATGYYHLNLWSVDCDRLSYNGSSYDDIPVIKTIYDPCPVGLKIPETNAFTGFTISGSLETNPAQFNVSGEWDYGWHFKAGGSSTETVYFPATGFRYTGGVISSQGTRCDCRTAGLRTIGGSLSLIFIKGAVLTPWNTNGGDRYIGLCVRPVAE